MGVELPRYPQGVLPAWCAPYIGLPYERGARGPDKWDCWGFLMLVQRECFGRSIPDYESVCWHGDDRASRKHTAAVIAQESALHWTPIEPGHEQAGDAIVLRIYGAPLHVGVVAIPGWMLHASEGAESAGERYDTMCWRQRVEGFHRLKGDA